MLVTPRLSWLVNVPDDLVDPTDIDISYGMACVVHTPGLRCWANTWVNPFSRATSVAAGDRFVCALTDAEEGVECFDEEDLIEAPAALEHASALYASGGDACATVDDSLLCWGTSITRRTVGNLKAFDVSHGGGCYVNDDGLHCFSTWQP